MDGQRHNASRRRKSKRSRAEDKPNGQQRTQARQEPILIAARRPNAPAARPKRRFIAASAAPRKSERLGGALVGPDLPDQPQANATQATQLQANARPDSRRVQAGSQSQAPHQPDAVDSAGVNAVGDGEDASRRRPARIVQATSNGPDDREKERLKLIDRLLRSEGRAAITRAARELEAAGFEYPVVQDVQLQLLEHFDECFAHQAICHLAELLNEEAPIKRPLFEQRLRRLEEFAEDADTRRAAAELRRAVRA